MAETTSVTDRIRARLQPLAPHFIAIEDLSAKHAGHSGAQSGGGHYNLHIVAGCFAGKTSVARHRMIYTALADMMDSEIHALSIHAQECACPLNE
jgi:BolA protein